jgi:hypothetical protein
MEHAPERAPEPVAEAAPAAAPLGAAVTAFGAGARGVARILALQRSAGNAAVVRLLQREAAAAAGRVDTPVGTVYAQPDLASEHVGELPRDAPVTVKGQTGDFWQIDQGYVYWMELAVTPADATAGGATAAVDTKDWRQVLPDATPRGGQGLGNRAGHATAQGPLIGYAPGAGNLPTATYGKRGGQEVAEAAPLPAGVTQADVDAAAAAVAAARSNVRERFLRVTQSTVSGSDFFGYESTPKLDQGLAGNTQRSAQRFKAADPDAQQTADASKDYMTWLRDPATKPSQCDNANDMRWRVFRRMMDWEGSPSAVNAFDKANVTLGAGFAGAAGGAVQPKGQAQELMGDLLARSPQAAGLFLAAGLTVSGGDFVVADPVRKWKLHGMDAELYIRADPELLSLYVNVAQGTFLADKSTAGPPADTRQATLDANFATFLNHALKSNPPLGADVDLAALKVHAAHSGNIEIGQVAGLATIADVVAFVYAHVSREQADAIVVEPAWRALAPKP